MSYFESRLKVNIKDFDELKRKLEFCKILGIKNLILEPTNIFEQIPQELKEKVNQITNINIYYRFNLKPISLNDFKNRIKNFKYFPFILSVESIDKEIQINAARDSRVDIISFSDENILKTLTPGVISLTKQNNSFIEFSLAPIMNINKALQSKNFRNLYKFIQLALKLNADYIISGNFDDLYDLRHPRSLLSICHSLLDIPLNEAKKGVIDNPKLLIERVQNRKKNNIIDSGIKFIRRGELK
ncbi:MAG: RNase P subunit p30 family protein [Promethearchaeota archaeon]